MFRRFQICVLAVVLGGPLSGLARGQGWGALDWIEESERSQLPAQAAFTQQRVESDRLPAAVKQAAEGAVPGFRLGEAYAVRHRSYDYWRTIKGFTLKGRDPRGLEVTIRTDDNGRAPVVNRVIPMESVPAAVLAEARAYAAKRGYTLRSAVLQVRHERSFGREVERTAYYVKGTTPKHPRAERLVWVHEPGRFRIRQLDEIWRMTIEE
jgi:hypothetical protein